MQSDEGQIRRLMDDWRRHTADGNVDAVLALMTDDALFLTAGNAPMSKQDFAAAARSFSGKMRFEATQEVKEICVSGNLAYAHTYVAVAITSNAAGGRTERAGHILTVFRKSPSGRWLLARDANLMMAR